MARRGIQEGGWGFRPSAGLGLDLLWVQFRFLRPQVSSQPPFLATHSGPQCCPRLAPLPSFRSWIQLARPPRNRPWLGNSPVSSVSLFYRFPPTRKLLPCAKSPSSHHSLFLSEPNGVKKLSTLLISRFPPPTPQTTETRLCTPYSEGLL